MHHDDLELIQKSALRDMAEGMLVIRFDGTIIQLNPAALSILDRKEEELLGRRFASCFFTSEDNDDFCQMILDAVYDREHVHRGVVTYHTSSALKQLSITTSFLHNNEEKVGVVAVINDLSELMELRDAVKAMERIKNLNHQLSLRNQLIQKTFGRFLSDEIVSQILDTPDGYSVGGKKRNVTILMSDLRGFTAISERMQPQELLTMLNHYLAQMTDCIQKYHGTIIEFIGDGIFAIFGAPAATDTHAADAVAAAILMQKRMTEICRWNLERGFPALQMGIGINTGDVILGNIGSEQRMKYGVVGSHVNLAGRLEGFSVGGQILISPYTRRQICAELQIAEEKNVQAKGVNEALVISSVTGIGEPYALSYRVQEQLLHKPEIPTAVEFRLLKNKNVLPEKNSGRLIALGPEGAVLQTQCPLGPMDDLDIDIGAHLFAKVTQTEEDGCRLTFTSKPDGFDGWMHRQFCRRPSE